MPRLLASLDAPGSGVSTLHAAAVEVLRATDAVTAARNGDGHPGDHDHVIGDITYGEGRDHPCSLVSDCAACGGAQYGTEDDLNRAIGALRAAVGQEPKPWERT